jgi:conjugal transfer mating pair stabilization protein TraG
MFDIVSFGEYKMLVDAFNGLAMIFASSSTVNMMRVAFLVGILWFGARAVMTNRWDAIPLFTGFLAYSLMFGPKVTVTVTDAYSGRVEAVANVPIGIAAPMSITSHAGRYFSDTFNQAYSVIVPDNSFMTNGFLDTLNVLLAFRDPDISWASSQPDGNVKKSLESYINDCVEYDLSIEANGGSPDVTTAKLMNAHDTWAAMRVTLINLMTSQFIETGYPTLVSCNVAYAILDGKLNTTTATWVTSYFDSWINQGITKSRSDTALSADQRVQSALSALNISSSRSREYMVNQLMATYLASGSANHAVSNGNVTAAVILTQGMNQRNVQWTAEQSMFERVSRPITAFIEVFMVAAAPIMAFAVAALGPQGLATLGKFLMLHVWVAMWAPTLTIVHMYIASTLVTYMERIADTSGHDPLSLAGLDSLNMTLQTQLGVGGMLAAATPMLTLFMLYGTAQVATMIASQIKGSEHIDTAPASPKLVQAGVFAAQDAGWRQNANTQSSTRVGGSEMSLSANTSALVGQAQTMTSSLSANKAFEQSINGRYGFSDSAADHISVGKDGTLSSNGQIGKTVSALYTTGLQAAQGRNWSAQQQAAFATDFVDSSLNQISGGIGMPKPGAPGGLAGAVVSMGSAGYQHSKSWGGKNASSAGLTDAEQASALRTASSMAQKNEILSSQDSTSMSSAQKFAAGWQAQHGRSQEGSVAMAERGAVSISQVQAVAEQQAYNRIAATGLSNNIAQLRDNASRNLGPGWREHIGELFKSAYGSPDDPVAQQRGAAALEQRMNDSSFRNVQFDDQHRDPRAVAMASLMLGNVGSEGANGPGSRLYGDILGVKGVEIGSFDAAKAQIPTGLLPDVGRTTGAVSTAAAAVATQAGTAIEMLNGADAKKGGATKRTLDSFSPASVSAFVDKQLGRIDGTHYDSRRMVEDAVPGNRAESERISRILHAQFVAMPPDAREDAVKSLIDARERGDVERRLSENSQNIHEHAGQVGWEGAASSRAWEYGAPKSRHP